MTYDAGRHIGNGIAWFGFWIMLGLINFGENPTVVQPTIEKIQELSK